LSETRSLNFGKTTYFFSVSCLQCDISIPHGDPLQFGGSFVISVMKVDEED